VLTPAKRREKPKDERSYEIGNSENQRETVANEALGDRFGGGCGLVDGIPDIGPCPVTSYSSLLFQRQP